MDRRIRIEQHGGLGLVWFAGWLFTIGYLELGFWKGLLGLLVWPYFLGVDLVLVGGNGFRAVGAIDAVEADTGVPIVTANSALLWHTLRTLGRPADTITRYGRIFTGG